jgi:hypothetical protein
LSLLAGLECDRVGRRELLVIVPVARHPPRIIVGAALVLALLEYEDKVTRIEVPISVGIPGNDDLKTNRSTDRPAGRGACIDSVGEHGLAGQLVCFHDNPFDK